MHRGIVLLLFVAALAIGCRESSDSQIESVVREFHAAFDRKELTAMRDFCTKDMFWYTLNGKTLNASQISDYFTPMLARWDTIKTELNGLEIRREGGLAVARYKSSIAITSNGKPSTMQNYYTTVLVKQGGSWKIWQHQMTTSY